MDEAVQRLMSGEARSGSANAARGALWTLSAAYGGLISLRNLAFDRGWRTVHRVDLPVISVGNLTTGGTGKTPVVAWIARQLQAVGERPVILSRGYRRLSVGDNDETRVLAELCPGVPQVLDPNRVRGAATARQQHHASVLILDDGFQHRRLHRDLDLVLIDALNPWGYGHLLPRGLLRESVHSVMRADVVIITRADLATDDALADIEWTLRRLRGRADALRLGFRPTRCRNARGEVRPWTEFLPANAVAFCGIGHPQGFETMLARMGLSAPCLRFPDHHHYTAADCAAIATWQQQHQADCVFTTLKDLVKWPTDTALSPLPVWAVETDVALLTGEAIWRDRLNGVMLPWRVPSREYAA
jgi:tetraacyldisaccharide 4'-kinase